MKKYIAMGAATLIVLGGLWAIQQYVRHIPNEEAFVVQTVRTQCTVAASGKVEEVNGIGVYGAIPLTARSVYVSDGDSVRRGDVLAVVDRIKTMELLQKQYADSLSLLATAGSLQNGLMQGLTQNDLLPYYIRAPKSGTVTQVNLHEGELSNTEQPLFRISNGGEKRVRLAISEDEIGSVKEEQAVFLTGKGIARTYCGKVAKIASEATVQSDAKSTVEVDVTVTDADEALKPGFTVAAQIQTQELQNVIVIPYSCVQIDETCAEYVYRAENGRAVRQTVTLGKETESGYIVASGLQPGDVVLQNPENLAQHARIRPCFLEDNQ